MSGQTEYVEPDTYHLIGSNCPEFRNELLGSFFFKLTLGSNCFKLCFWRVVFKTIVTQQCYKNTSRFQTRALNTIRDENLKQLWFIKTKRKNIKSMQHIFG